LPAYPALEYEVWPTRFLAGSFIFNDHNFTDPSNSYNKPYNENFPTLPDIADGRRQPHT
jgi:hypothetical protein